MIYRYGKPIITVLQIQSMNIKWDDYQALPEDVKNNGTYYNITDWQQSTMSIVETIVAENIRLESRIAELENANTYSEEEVRIGIWVDMKPVYRKVYTIDTFTASTAISIPNIKEVVNLKLIRRFDSRANLWICGDGVASANNLYFSYDTDVVRINTVSSGGTIYSLTAIVEYTKTTD